MNKQRQLVLIVFYLFLTMAIFSRLGFCSTFTDLIEKAKHVDYDQAIKLYTQAIEKWTPQDGVNNKIKAYFNRANKYSLQKKYDLAIKDYTEVIRFNPKNSLAYVRRSDIYFIQKKYDLAIKDYTEVTHLAPKDPEAYFGRGSAYYLKAQYDLAIKDYTEAIHLDPKNVGAYEGRCAAYAKKGNIVKALLDLAKAKSLK